jgi:D-alanine-D-alanine ligase
MTPMRIVILHSDVPADAPPDEQDTLLQAAAIQSALKRQGHDASLAVFAPDAAGLESLIEREDPDAVFNLVESIWGSDHFAPLAPAMLSDLGVPFTGVHSAPMAACGDKVLSKRILKAARLPTPAWSEPPRWKGTLKGKWIVKSVTEDASFGLDDGAVVEGRDKVVSRAQSCAARLGGRWFAEKFIDGREFNVALIESDGAPEVLPIGEMVFDQWDETRPRIVGYAAKWNADTAEYRDTARIFGWQTAEPDLNKSLEKLAMECWTLFGLSGYARVDFRVDAAGKPFILEVNPNPCLEPDAGYAAAGAAAGLSYDQLIATILRAALAS